MTSVILTRKEFGKKMKNKYNAFTSYLAKKARIFFWHQSPIPESKCIIIGENEFAAAAKCAFFFSSSIFTSFRSGEPEPGSSSNFKNNNHRKGPIVRRFLEWLIEKASLYLDSAPAADVANEELEQSGDNGLDPPLPPQRFVFKSV